MTYNYLAVKDDLVDRARKAISHTVRKEMPRKCEINIDNP
jgi:hypothetical protein